MTPITDAEISEIEHMDLCLMSIETAFVVERQLRRIIARMREAEKTPPAPEASDRTTE